MVIIWPAGTSSDGKSLDTAIGVIEPGDDLTLAGGEAAGTGASDLSNQCGNSDVFQVWEIS